MRDTKGWEMGLEEGVRIGHVVKAQGIRSGTGGQGTGSGDRGRVQGGVGIGRVVRG